MTFVNEFVKNEDLHKYHIYELWHELKPFSDIQPDSDCELRWTVDREREMFLMRYESIRETEIVKWLFVFQGEVYLISLNRKLPEGQPLIMRWELLDIEMPDNAKLSKETLISYLKEGLSVFGVSGIISQGKNRYQIEFTF